jgi:hypothetical protein
MNYLWRRCKATHDKCTFYMAVINVCIALFFTASLSAFTIIQLIRLDGLKAEWKIAHELNTELSDLQWRTDFHLRHWKRDKKKHKIKNGKNKMMRR